MGTVRTLCVRPKTIPVTIATATPPQSGSPRQTANQPANNPATKIASVPRFSTPPPLADELALRGKDERARDADGRRPEGGPEQDIDDLPRLRTTWKVTRSGHPMPIGTFKGFSSSIDMKSRKMKWKRSVVSPSRTPKWFQGSAGTAGRSTSARMALSASRGGPARRITRGFPIGSRRTGHRLAPQTGHPQTQGRRACRAPHKCR